MQTSLRAKYITKGINGFYKGNQGKLLQMTLKANKLLHFLKHDTYGMNQTVGFDNMISFFSWLLMIIYKVNSHYLFSKDYKKIILKQQNAAYYDCMEYFSRWQSAMLVLVRLNQRTSLPLFSSISNVCTCNVIELKRVNVTLK